MARHGLTAALLSVLLVLPAGCGAAATPTPDAATTPAPVPVVVPAPGGPGGTGPGGPTPAPGTAAGSAPAAYLAAWCYAPAEQTANTNLRNAAAWMTAAGWADDAARAVDDPTWARTRAAGVSTVCGPVTGAVLPHGPNTDTTTWVLVSARQGRVRGGALIGQSPVSMVRRLLRAPDGRWLVDVRVMAG